MEKMNQEEYKSEAICSKVDLDIYDDLDLTLSLGLPNQVIGKKVNNISQPHKSTDLICSQEAMDALNCSQNQALKSSTMVVVPVSVRNKENAMFSKSWPLMSNQSIMRELVQMPKATIREAPAPSNITMMSISCNYHNMNNRIAYPPKNHMNYNCYIILDPSKKTKGRSSSSSRKRRSKTKTKLQSSSSSSSSGSRRGQSNTKFTKPEQRDPDKRCTNYNCGVGFSPMWRRGPLGPKSLCNACGIRFRKQEQKRMEEEKTANEAVKMAAAEQGSEISCTSTANTIDRCIAIPCNTIDQVAWTL